jgi:hypothetical protein
MGKEAAAAGPLRRILAEAGVPDLVDVLARMPATDLASVLLEVMRAKAADVSPAQLLRAYEASRFVTPAAVDPPTLSVVEAAAFAALPDGFETLALAPLVPLGTHRSIATVDQNNVVTTIRGTEVAADPTNALALEAALRRRRLLGDDPRSAALVRLAASQRVVRGQLFTGEGFYAHFQLFGLVTAGRDTGSLSFEQQAAVEHSEMAVATCLAAGATAVRLDVTDFAAGRMAPVCQRVRDAFVGRPGVEVVDRPDRPSGHGYYSGFCFKVHAALDGTTLEVGDGGLVDWTQQLVASRKERLLISGLGLERLAMPVGPYTG